MKPVNTKASGEGDTLLLPLTDPDHLFNAPSVNPLTSSLPEILGISGADYLLSQLRTRRFARTAVLALPEDQIVPGLAERTEKALRRFAEHRIQQEQTSLRNIRWRGWRATLIALFLLAISLTIASFFGSEVTRGVPSVLRRTLEYGFEITGWVMLWHPIELLVFEPFQTKDKIAALCRLAELRVVLRSWKECGVFIENL